jgi:hypothetical protein
MTIGPGVRNRDLRLAQRRPALSIGAAAASGPSTIANVSRPAVRDRDPRIRRFSKTRNCLFLFFKKSCAVRATQIAAASDGCLRPAS